MRKRLIIPTVVITAVVLIAVICMFVFHIATTPAAMLNEHANDTLDTVSGDISYMQTISSDEATGLDKGNLAIAKAVAKLIAQDPGSLSSSWLTSLASASGVDEISVSDANGVVQWSNKQGSLSTNFSSDAETKPYMALLNQTDGTYAADTTRKPGSDDMYQYVAVSREDTAGIIEVGNVASPLDELSLDTSLQPLVQNIITSPNEGVFVLDSTGTIIADSSNTYTGASLKNQSWFASAIAGNNESFSFKLGDNEVLASGRLVSNYLAIAYVPASGMQTYLTNPLTVVIIGILVWLVAMLIAILVIVKKKDVTRRTNDAT
ncbi:MAG: hypothetical protein LBM21_00420 [Coriobacteriales bacterium]|jgi:methyl-accepting chemotaxis protein|nr:hypothetical protein [Coriobacteriales bacterium]